MKKWLVQILAALASTFLVVALLSFYMGGRIHTAVQSQIAKWEDKGYAKIEVLDYQRGIFSSTAHSRWTVEGDESSYQIEAQHDIRHGPFPHGKAATVATTFYLPAGSDPHVLQALQGAHLAQWNAAVQWNHQAHHQLSSQPLQIDFDDGSSIRWGGLQAQWQVSAQQDHIQGSLDVPLLQAKTPEIDNNLAVSGLHLEMDTQYAAQESFWSGPITLEVGSIEIQDPEVAHVRARQLRLHALTTLNNRLVSLQLQSQAAEAMTPDQGIRQLELAMRFDNIDVQWFKDTLAWLGSNAEEEDVHVAALLDGLNQLLAAQPKIQFEKLAFETDAGISEIKGHLAYTGQQADTFDISEVQAALHATFPQSVVEHWLASKVRNDYVLLLDQLGQAFNETELEHAIASGVHKRLQSLLSLGAIKNQQDRFSAELVFDRDGLQLNGQPTAFQDLLMLGEAM